MEAVIPNLKTLMNGTPDLHKSSKITPTDVLPRTLSPFSDTLSTFSETSVTDLNERNVSDSRRRLIIR